MFWMLKLMKDRRSSPRRLSMAMYFREASRLSSSDLAPVTTNFPDVNASAVLRHCPSEPSERMRMEHAANLEGWNCACVSVCVCASEHGLRQTYFKSIALGEFEQIQGFPAVKG